MMVVLIVILCCSYVLWKLLSKTKTCLEPPELSGWWPIVGHGYQFLGDGAKVYNGLKALSEECLEKGGVIRWMLGPYKLYDPDDSLTVINTCLEKSFLFKFGKLFLGNGLLLADGKKWQLNRKLLNPAFNQRVLDGFIDIFNTQAEDLVNKFAAETGKPFDHEMHLRVNNLETICSTSFGLNVNEYRDIFKNYLPLLKNIISAVCNRATKFWLYNDFIYSMTREKKQFEKDVNGLIDLSKTIVRNKKSERENKSYTIINDGKPKKFIDLILDIADETGRFTDEEIREETDNIVAGGHETTASTLTFVFTLLGSHTDVQDKLYDEIIQVCGSTKIVNKDDLSKLVYTEAVLKETLRMYPIGMILPRYIDKDVKLISVHGINRHSMWGPDADKFRPERWLDKETLPDPKYYGAFGLGRRNCIGKVYAMMSMKIILAHVIRRYRVSSDISKMVLAFHTTIRPESGYFISLEQRNPLA